jgi:starch synthase (maltosyl-transferring)
MDIKEGRIRVVIEGVSPEIDCGRFAVKRIVGDVIQIEADIFTDGHDALSAVLLYRHDSDSVWTENPMDLIGNDRWKGTFTAKKLGIYRYTIMAWVDQFMSWKLDLEKKFKASQDVTLDLIIGAQLIEEAAKWASGKSAKQHLLRWASDLRSDLLSHNEKIQAAFKPEVTSVVCKHADRRFALTYGRELTVIVDTEKARFSTWYELFPRSCSPERGKHGTFKDCEARLPHIAKMGFDVLYLPPIHPIGETNRKGKNNITHIQTGDPGSPWAIGSKEGGHKAVHPELGNLEDFRNLIASAKKNNIDIALDMAFNCTPDHPYVKKHPQWFRYRPDGTVQYAENPPKKYQDIYPFNFETDAWMELWEELKEIVLFWIEQGVRIFRVDNPHTKPFRFWEWLISEIKREYPDIIFLAEAFTRPKVMYQLAKIGFSQSYTYFAWRNTKSELTQYFTELTKTELKEFFRPNLWPNTPDILTEYLQFGGRQSFMTRLLLAATLGANYGIYGPAFELCENQPREPGSEEYLNSEKYEIRKWDINKPENLNSFITRVNQIRRKNPALHNDTSLQFHDINNDQLICYSKHTDDHSNIVLPATIPGT